MQPYGGLRLGSLAAGQAVKVAQVQQLESQHPCTAAER